MEIYFTVLCIIKIMFNYVLNFSGVLHIYRIRLLNPAAFNFKMREITAKNVFNIALDK